MVSNYAACHKIEATVDGIVNLTKIDNTLMTSERTRMFVNLSSSLFSSDGANELWTQSALRFFIMEDIMINKGYTELVHIEADNLIYGRYTTILDTLRKGYPNLAVTPLTASKFFFTASVLWIGNLKVLQYE